MHDALRIPRKVWKSKADVRQVQLRLALCVIGNWQNQLDVMEETRTPGSVAKLTKCVNSLASQLWTTRPHFPSNEASLERLVNLLTTLKAKIEKEISNAA